MNRSKLSIVISMYNSNREILKFIERLLFPSLLQNADKTKELILLDDLSPLREKTNFLVENHRKKFTSSFVDFKYIQNRKNLGFAKSYNKGIRLAKGRQILIANSDVYFPKGSINALSKILESNKKFGIVGPVTNGAAGFQNTHLFPRLKNYSKDEIKRIEGFASWLKKVTDGQCVKNVALIGFCLCCKKEIFQKVGYFDPRFKAGGAEDIDLVLRTGKYYFTILDCSTFVVHGGTTGPLLSFRRSSIKKIFQYLLLSPIKYAHKWNSWFSLPFASIKGLLQYLFDIDTVTAIIIKRAKAKRLWDEYNRLIQST